jgi:hypothetical protein
MVRIEEIEEILSCPEVLNNLRKRGKNGTK